MDILQVRTSKSIGAYLGCRNIDCKRTRGDFTAPKKKAVVNWLDGKLGFHLRQVNCTYQIESSRYSFIYYAGYKYT